MPRVRVKRSVSRTTASTSSLVESSFPTSTIEEMRTLLEEATATSYVLTTIATTTEIGLVTDTMILQTHTPDTISGAVETSLINILTHDITTATETNIFVPTTIITTTDNGLTATLAPLSTEVLLSVEATMTTDYLLSTPTVMTPIVSTEFYGVSTTTMMNEVFATVSTMFDMATETSIMTEDMHTLSLPTITATATESDSGSEPTLVSDASVSGSSQIPLSNSSSGSNSDSSSSASTSSSTSSSDSELSDGSLNVSSASGSGSKSRQNTSNGGNNEGNNSGSSDKGVIAGAVILGGLVAGIIGTAYWRKRAFASRHRANLNAATGVSYRYAHSNSPYRSTNSFISANQNSEGFRQLL